MSHEIIDKAIQRHLDWVAGFHAALAGTGPKEFDLERARDDTACALGRWFADPESLAALGQEFHPRAMALHATFHEIGGEVICSLRANDPPEVTKALIDAMEDLSKSIVEFMQYARHRLEDGPTEWVVR